VLKTIQEFGVVRTALNRGDGVRPGAQQDGHHHRKESGFYSSTRYSLRTVFLNTASM